MGRGFLGLRSGSWGLFLLLAGSVASAREHSVHQFPLDLEVEIETTALTNGETFEYLFESFGNTKLQILAKYSGDALADKDLTPLSAVPLAGASRVATITHSPLGQSNGGYLKYEFLLTEPGVYRFAPAAKHTLWKARCLANCGRAEISLTEAFKGMNDTELRVVSDKIGALFGSKLPANPAALEAVNAIRQEVLKRNPAFGDRFPTLPDFATLDHVRELLTMMGDGNKSTSPLLDKNLVWEERLLVYRKLPKPDPEIVDPRTPHIRYGHFMSPTVSDEMVAQNQALAEVMTLLSLSKGHVVEFPAGPRASEKVTSLGALIELLWSTGHRIQIRDERSFANFLAFTWHDKYIRWPAWFRTGLYLSPKEEILFPLPHSQFVFQIRGPEINARVNFFLGMTGAAFFPHFDELRPQWTGFASVNQLTDSNELHKPLIKEAFRAAEIYLRRNKWEYPRFAKKFPADGYGYLGVCNDATAAIERILFKKTSFYPLFRSPELTELSRRDDGLDPIFDILPNDSLPLGALKGGPGQRDEILARLHAMTAYPFDPSFRWDATLFNQLERTNKRRP